MKQIITMISPAGGNSGYAMPQQSLCCSSLTYQDLCHVLGNDKSFKASHLDPIPFHFVVGIMGK